MAERAASVLRSGEWWDHKLVPILCAFYATMVRLGLPIASQWQVLLVLLLSLVPGAAYVSIVNDLTDLEADAAAGKANRMAGRPPAFRIAALLLPLLCGGVFFWVWRGQPLALFLYAGAWIAFTLYSVPPFRLKARGLAGVVADACGAHLFPTLLAAALPFAAAGLPPDRLWLAAVGAWSLAHGLRGNLWHQLLDRERDRTAGVATFAARHPPAAAARLGAWVAFPVELAALAGLFRLMASPWPPLALIPYALLVARRVRLWHMEAVVVEPKGAYLILLHEYYLAFLPLAILAGSALVHRVDWVLLAFHLLLFGREPLRTWCDAWSLILRPALQRLGIVAPPKPAMP
ncbi:MAG TPA: UbiA family prenyltransferase [Allosphingosinicella sp.]